MDVTSDPLTDPGSYLAIAQPGIYLPSKRDFLFFDQVGIVSLEANLGDFAPHIAADFEYLADRGVIFDAVFDESRGFIPGLNPGELSAIAHDALVAAILGYVVDSKEFDKLDVPLSVLEEILSINPLSRYVERAAIAHQAKETLKGYRVRMASFDDLKHMDALFQAVEREARTLILRSVCTHLSTLHNGVDVQPLLHAAPSAGNILPESSHRSVIDITLRHFPTPDDSVPWEHILEFRADKEAVRARRRLRRWMSELSNADQSRPREAAQELEHLLDAYEGYMELHRMKINRSTLRTIVVSGAEIIENIARLRFSTLAQKLFSATDRKIALLEAERNAPGREVAYIAQAKSAFGS